MKKDEGKAARGESCLEERGLGRVKRIDVAAGRRCVIYFPSLPRRGRTLNRRGVPRALYAPMNQSYTTTTVFHSRTTLGRAAKILRKSQAMINHADASYKWNRVKYKLSDKITSFYFIIITICFSSILLNPHFIKTLFESVNILYKF